MSASLSSPKPIRQTIFLQITYIPSSVLKLIYLVFSIVKSSIQNETSKTNFTMVLDMDPTHVVPDGDPDLYTAHTGGVHFDIPETVREGILLKTRLIHMVT